MPVSYGGWLCTETDLTGVRGLEALELFILPERTVGHFLISTVFNRGLVRRAVMSSNNRFPFACDGVVRRWEVVTVEGGPPSKRCTLNGS